MRAAGAAVLLVLLVLPRFATQLLTLFPSFHRGVCYGCGKEFKKDVTGEWGCTERHEFCADCWEGHPGNRADDDAPADDAPAGGHIFQHCQCNFQIDLQCCCFPTSKSFEDRFGRDNIAWYSDGTRPNWPRCRVCQLTTVNLICDSRAFMFMIDDDGKTINIPDGVFQMFDLNACQTENVKGVIRGNNG